MDKRDNMPCKEFRDIIDGDFCPPPSGNHEVMVDISVNEFVGIMRCADTAIQLLLENGYEFEANELEERLSKFNHLAD